MDNKEKNIEKEDHNKKTKKKFSNTILGILLTAFLIILIGDIIGEILIGILSITTTLVNKYEIFFLYLSTIGTIISIIVYLLLSKNNNYMLKKISFKSSHFLLGLVIGGTLNIICAISAMLHNDLLLIHGNAGVIGLLIALILVCIQSTSEELICRLFVYQKLKENYKSPLVWILVNSLFFGFLHIFNDGITLLAMIDLIIYGLLMSLMIYYFDSIWLASAIHTSWNFMQNFILGLPNSGIPSTYSLYNISNSHNSFFYNTIFGVEGTMFCVLLLSFTALLVYLLCRKEKIINN